MKKTLAMGLGAMLAVGAAGQASAASQIDFSGYYRVYSMTDVNLGRQTEDASFTDSYWGSRLNIDLTFHATDELEVSWRMRAPHFKRWGSGADNRSGIDLGTYHVYGLIKQDWGNVYIGRLDEDLDVYGLATLGYLPETNPVWTTVGPFEEAGVFDGVRYVNEWDNGFALMAQYAKVDNNGGDSIGANADGQGRPLNFHSDQDYDQYLVEAAYKWDGGGVSLGAIYERDATTYDGTDNAAFNAFYLNPAFMQTWGDFSVHFEGKAGWGKADGLYRGVSDDKAEGYAAYLDFDYNYGPGNVTLAGWYASGTGLDELYKSGDAKSKSLVSMGGNFLPLIVAYNDASSGYGRVGHSSYAQANGIESNSNAISLANNAFANYVADGRSNFTALNNGIDLQTLAGGGGTSWFAFDVLSNMFGAQNRTSSLNEGTEANHWAVAVSGNQTLTDDISMHYALAYLALAKPNYRVATRSTYHTAMNADGANWYNNSYKEQDKDMGFEIDLGFSFQLLDNLQFTTAFGYMFTGDAYKTMKGYNVRKGAGNTNMTGIQDGDSIQAVWKDGDDAYTWYNTLTFSF